METGEGFWYNYLVITDEEKARIAEMHKEIERLEIYGFIMTVVAIILLVIHFI